MGFSQDLKKFVHKEVITKHTKNAQKVEDYIYNQVVKNSPVGKSRKGYVGGAYRANHHRTTGAPLFTFDPHKTSNTEPAPTGGKFESFFIANGAPYAWRLEHGWSEQAENGVYKVAVQSARARFRI